MKNFLIISIPYFPAAEQEAEHLSISAGFFPVYWGGAEMELNIGSQLHKRDGIQSMESRTAQGEHPHLLLAMQGMRFPTTPEGAIDEPRAEALLNAARRA